MRKRSIKNKLFEYSQMIFMGVIIVGGIVGTYSVNYGNKQELKVTITDKEVKRSSESDKYMIFAKDQNNIAYVFENTDMLFKGKFNSSDVQAKLEIGKEYTITTYGYRVPFLSMYPNVAEVK